jgi:hypothetical protein
MPLSAAFDYPSQRSGLQFPVEPMLLDTSLLQHLKTVMDAMDEEYLTNAAADLLLLRHPEPLGPELVALGELVTVLRRNGPSWVVSEASLIEFERLNNAKGAQFRQWWYEWADYFNGCLDGGWYPDIDPKPLIVRPLVTVADGQLSFSIEPARWSLSPECVPTFGPFRDAGDRALIRQALRAGLPTILTTDLRSFWRYRRALYPLGIEIWRPTDLWQTFQHRAA